MRLAIPFALVLAATTGAPRQGCGNGTNGGTPPAYDPCAGKACGEGCRVCPPDDPACVETMVVKACDPFHRCVPQVEGLCAAATGACEGKACGTPCTIDPPCRSATPPCMMPSIAGRCDSTGACNPEPPTPDFCPPAPSWGCVGKTCGDSCGFCPPGTDPAECPVPTFAATACDAALQCVTVGTFTCSPQAACLGKPCGAPCDTCPACAGPGPAAQACDASGACVVGAPTGPAP